MPKLKKHTPDKDNPEWTTSDFKKAKHFPRGRSLVSATTEMMKSRGRPKLENPKVSIKLRLDSDILAAYRKTGEGWQTQINADLRKAKKLKPEARRRAE